MYINNVIGIVHKYFNKKLQTYKLDFLLLTILLSI